MEKPTGSVQEENAKIQILTAQLKGAIDEWKRLLDQAEKQKEPGLIPITVEQAKIFKNPTLLFYANKRQDLIDGKPRFKITKEEWRKTREYIDNLKKAKFCQFTYHRDTNEYEILPPN